MRLNRWDSQELLEPGEMSTSETIIDGGDFNIVRSPAQQVMQQRVNNHVTGLIPDVA